MFDICFTDNGQKDCTTVIARVNTGLSCELPVLQFSWETDRQYTCQLLKKHLEEELNKAIENAHKLAYEQGYKDGRAKQKKKRAFSIVFSKTPCIY